MAAMPVHPQIQQVIDALAASEFGPVHRRCGMLVDSGAGALILPMAWKERLGTFKRSEVVELQLANQEVLRGEACWPVEIRIDGFRPVSNEVVFVDMGSEDEGEYEPLLGYGILEQAQAAVDMLGHRLVPVKYIDMKSMRRGDFAPSATCRHDTTCAVAAESIVGIEPKWAMQPVGVVAASTVQ